MRTTFPRLALPTLLACAAMAGSAGGAPAPRGAARPSAQAAIVGADDAAIEQDARRIDRAKDGLFYVHARVNGRPVRFLIDTGASVVVLTAADAAAAGVAPDPATFAHSMQTAAGSAAMAWTSLDEVRVAGRAVRGVKAAVMREGLGVSLLGQNMLARMGPIRIEGDRIDLG